MSWSVYTVGETFKKVGKASTAKKATRKLNRLKASGQEGIATTKELDDNGIPVDGKPLNAVNTLTV